MRGIKRLEKAIVQITKLSRAAPDRVTVRIYDSLLLVLSAMRRSAEEVMREVDNDN